MILAKLKEFADTQIPSTPVMYSEKKVRWLIDLDFEGNLIGQFIPLGGDTKETKGGKPTVVTSWSLWEEATTYAACRYC